MKQKHVGTDYLFDPLKSVGIALYHLTQETKPKPKPKPRPNPRPTH
jgi:hypothetical protein